MVVGAAAYVASVRGGGLGVLVFIKELTLWSSLNVNGMM